MEQVPEVNEVDDRVINNIIKALSDYKMKIINKQTLITQNPSQLSSINSVLREKSKLIKYYIIYRTIPSEDDVDLNECIQRLKPLLNPWNSDTSILSKYWCEKIFETDNFSRGEHLQDIIINKTDDTVMPAKI
jgi:hypothetical protein